LAFPSSAVTRARDRPGRPAGVLASISYPMLFRAAAVPHHRAAELAA